MQQETRGGRATRGDRFQTRRARSPDPTGMSRSPSPEPSSSHARDITTPIEPVHSPTGDPMPVSLAVLLAADRVGHA